MPCRVVCISHATGARGEEVGRLVAERLGFVYVDEEIVLGAAAQGGLESHEVATEERRKSLVDRVFRLVAEGGSGALPLGAPMPLPLPDTLRSDDVRALIREAIAETAARGDVVIVAHAASHALGAAPETLRVLVTASAETRARRVEGERGLDAAAARAAVKESDAGRRDYLKRFYGVEAEAPTHYDLVVNTDVVPVEVAARIVADAGRA